MAAITQPHETAPSQQPKPIRKRPIDYPTGDGKPMAEDTLHQDLMFYAVASLRYHFRTRPDVYVAGNDFLYYEEGNPKARVSPDCYVVMGVQKHYRPSYKIWEENGVAPAVVFEFTSKKTRREDTTFKQPLYEQRLGVQEYIQFDPTGDYLTPRLQGQMLQHGRYQPMVLRNDRLLSVQLGLELVVEGETLRFFDTVGKEWLRTYTEAEAQRLEATQRAETEAQRAEFEKQRAEAETQRAEGEKQRADTEARRADVEAQRAADTAAENERLRTELEALRQQQALRER